MPTKVGISRPRRVVVDLTSSDEELEDTDSGHHSKVTLPNSSNPRKPRRFTAAECLLADRIAYGEVESVSDPCPRAPSSQPLIEERGLVRDNEIHSQRYASDFNSYPREKERDYHSIRTSFEDEDSSDHESVLDQEEDSSVSGRYEQTPEFVEMMASGRPRRACAPRSFKGLLRESSFESKEFTNPDALRAYVIERITIAHHNLWKNRTVKGYSYSCGRTDDGNARNAMMCIAHSFGAKGKVRKVLESGTKVKHVVLKCGRRLQSPSELNIQECTDRMMTRLHLFSDSSNVQKSLNDGASIQFTSDGLGKKDNIRRKSNVTVRVNRAATKGAESEQEVKKQEGAIRIGEVINEDKLRADLIEGATIAHRKLWENRLVGGFSHNYGRVDDGNVRHAIIEIAQSFGAICKVQKMSESGKKVKHIVLKCGSCLRPPSELNIQESVDRSMFRLRNLSGADSCDLKDPCRSIQDGVSNDVQQARTTSAIVHRESLTKRELSPKGQIERRTKNSGKSVFQQKRQRKLEGTKIGTANKGFSMLTKMGWTEGGRLGAKENGISEPIVAQFRIGRGGLGTK